MDTSDFIIIGSTITLAVVALVVPYLSELIKRKGFNPKLEFRYKHEPPYGVKTEWRSRQDPTLQEPVYFFRFEVLNTGQSQARLCEALLEELWLYDAAGNPQQLTNFTPVNLHWVVATSESSPSLRHINPQRPRILCDLGHISSTSYQTGEEAHRFIDVPGEHNAGLRFLFSVLSSPFSQPNCLVPGTYAIKVSLYCENASPQSQYFSINWSGRWQQETSNMFREIVIRPVESIRSQPSGD